MKPQIVTITAALLSLAIGTAFAADDTGKKVVDPVNLKPLTVAKETPLVVVGGNKLYFTDAKNRETFLKNPESYLKTPQVCPLKGTPGRANKANRLVVNDQIVYFCCTNCAEDFKKDPSLLGQVADPVSGKMFALAAGIPTSTYKGSIYYFESEASKAAFDKEPAKFAKVLIP